MHIPKKMKKTTYIIKIIEKITSSPALAALYYTKTEKETLNLLFVISVSHAR